MFKRSLALGTFVASSLYVYFWEWIRSQLYERAQHMLAPYFEWLTLDFLGKYGPPAILACIGLFLFWRTRPQMGTVAQANHAAKQVLSVPSPEDIKFREELIQFMATPLIGAGERLAGIFGSMNNIDMGSSGDAAFFVMQAVHNGLQSQLRSVQGLTAPPDRAGLSDLQLGALSFLRSYRATQDYIPKFVKITNVDPNRVGSVSLWLEADRECLRTLKLLKMRFPNQTSELNEQFSASANGFDGKVLSSLVTKSTLPPVSEKERALAERSRPASTVRLQITSIAFDLNGPTEMYARLIVSNPGPPTTIKNWQLSVYDGAKMIAAGISPRNVNSGRVVQNPITGPRQENLAEQPLEQGGERTGSLNFTFTRMVAEDLFGAKALRFRITADDISDQQLEASFTRE